MIDAHVVHHPIPGVVLDDEPLSLLRATSEGLIEYDEYCELVDEAARTTGQVTRRQRPSRRIRALVYAFGTQQARRAARVFGSQPGKALYRAMEVGYSM